MTIRTHIIQFLAQQSQKKYSVKVRVMATVLGATLFFIVFPLLSFWGGLTFLRTMFLPPAIAHFLSIMLFVWGIPWLVWAILWQLSEGDGTPVPVIPTIKFLPHGPYRYLRNPMIYGFSFYLFGWAIGFNRYGSILTALVIVILLIFEIKLIEESELERRFGDSYKDYKAKTPGFFPKFQFKK